MSNHSRNKGPTASCLILRIHVKFVNYLFSREKGKPPLFPELFRRKQVYKKRNAIRRLQIMMNLLFVLPVFATVSAEMCLRLLSLSYDERAIVKSIPGRFSWWNKVSQQFENLEALVQNETAICSVQLSDDIRGKTLVVAVDIMEPYIDLNENYTVPGGFIGEMWTTLEKALEFKTIYRRAGPSPSRALMNGPAHALLTPTAIHAYASSYYTYSTPFATNYYALFVQSEGTRVSNWWYVRIFSRGLWLTSCTFILGLTAFIMGTYALKKAFLVNYVECDNELASLSFNILHVLGGISGQGFPKMPTSWSLRLLIVSYLTMGMLLSCGFSSTLTSYLAIRGTSVPLSSLRDISKKRTHSLCIRNGSGAYIHFTEDGNIAGPLLPEWQDIVNKGCPDMRDAMSLESKLCKPGFVYLEAPDVFLPIYRRVQHECRIAQIPKRYWSLKLAFMHNRASKYRDVIDKWLMRLRSSGIMKYLESKYTSKSIEPPTSQWSTFYPVEYGHIHLATLSLAVMVLVSALICILENVWYRLRTNATKASPLLKTRKLDSSTRVCRSGNFMENNNHSAFYQRDPMTMRSFTRNYHERVRFFRENREAKRGEINEHFFIH